MSWELYFTRQAQKDAKKLAQSGLKSYLVNAYPTTFLNSIERGKRLRSANQLALDVGGVQMLDEVALVEGRAMAADLTGELWRQHMAYDDTDRQRSHQATGRR